MRVPLNGFRLEAPIGATERGDAERRFIARSACMDSMIVEVDTATETAALLDRRTAALIAAVIRGSSQPARKSGGTGRQTARSIGAPSASAASPPCAGGTAGNRVSALPSVAPCAHKTLDTSSASMGRANRKP